MVTLHDIMTVDVLTVSPEATLRQVAELLADEHISGVPVVAGTRVVGVISTTDFMEFDAESRAVPTAREEGRLDWESEPEEWEEGGSPPASFFVDYWDNVGAQVQERVDATDGPERDVLEEHTAGELMTRTVVSLPPETDVQEAARFILRTGVSRVLVMKDTELLGMVTTTDFVKAVAQHGLGG